MLNMNISIHGTCVCLDRGTMLADIWQPQHLNAEVSMEKSKLIVSMYFLLTLFVPAPLLVSDDNMQSLNNNNPASVVKLQG